jgi:hypothetical protein
MAVVGSVAPQNPHKSAHVRRNLRLAISGAPHSGENSLAREFAIFGGNPPDKSKPKSQAGIGEFESSQPSHGLRPIRRSPVSWRKPRISGALRSALARRDGKSGIFGRFGAVTGPQSPVANFESPEFNLAAAARESGPPLERRLIGARLCRWTRVAREAF